MGHKIVILQKVSPLCFFNLFKNENSFILDVVRYSIESDILINELRVNILTSCVYCTSYELLLTYELRVAVYLTSYELLSLQELAVTVYCRSYELLFIAQVTSYFLHTSYKLLFIARVTRTFLTFYKLRVVINCTIYELLFNYGLQ